MHHQSLRALILSLAAFSCGAEKARDAVAPVPVPVPVPAQTPTPAPQYALWHPEESLYHLPPFSTLAVCDTGVKAGVKDHVRNAIHTWLKAGNRDGLVHIVESCTDGDRIIKLVRVPDSVNYYGQVAPLRDRTSVVNVPDKWAAHWTANHEIGHLFGLAHVFEGTISIMDSAENGRYMNGGQLAAYDFAAVRSLLGMQDFARTNQLFDRARRSETLGVL